MEFLTTETFLIKMLFSLKKKCLNLAPPLKKKRVYKESHLMFAEHTHRLIRTRLQMRTATFRRFGNWPWPEPGLVLLMVGYVSRCAYHTLNRFPIKDASGEHRAFCNETMYKGASLKSYTVWNLCVWFYSQSITNLSFSSFFFISNSWYSFMVMTWL